jgi:hypothetical protein
MPINRLTLAASAPIAITLDGLARGAGRASAFVDNATNLYVDAHVSVKFTLDVTAGPVDHNVVYIHAYGSEDGTLAGPSGGSSGREAIDGTDKAITISTLPTALWTVRLCALTVHTGAGGSVYVSPPLSVAHAFGGVLPRRWGLVVANRSPFAFATPCSATYTGISSTT